MRIKSSSIEIKSWMNQNIQSPRIDIVFLLLAGGSSMIDVMTSIMLKVSVGHNTMNLIILAAGAVGLQNKYPLLIFPGRAAVVIGSSWLGAFIAGRLSRLNGTRKRWWLFTELTIQSAVVYLAAILLYTNVISLYNNTNHILIGLLGFSFGSQFTFLKLLAPLGCTTIPGQVVTGTMVDLMSGEELFRNTTARNQRILFLIIFFLGGVFGGLISVHEINPAVTIFMLGTVKFFAALVLLVLPGEVSIPIPLEAVVVVADQGKVTEKEGSSEVHGKEHGYNSESSSLRKNSFSSSSKYQINVSASIVK